MPGQADGERTVSRGAGPRLGGGEALGTPLAAQVHPLLSVLTQEAGNAVTLEVNLVTILTLWPALISGQSLSGPGGQANTTHVAEELALIRLVLAIATGAAEANNLVKELSSRAGLLAVTQLDASLLLGGASNSIDFWANVALDLGLF